MVTGMETSTMEEVLDQEEEDFLVLVILLDKIQKEAGMLIKAGVVSLEMELSQVFLLALVEEVAEEILYVRFASNIIIQQQIAEIDLTETLFQIFQLRVTFQ